MAITGEITGYFYGIILPEIGRFFSTDNWCDSGHNCFVMNPTWNPMTASCVDLYRGSDIKCSMGSSRLSCSAGQSEVRRFCCGMFGVILMGFMPFRDDSKRSYCTVVCYDETPNADLPLFSLFDDVYNVGGPHDKFPWLLQC